MTGPEIKPCPFCGCSQPRIVVCGGLCLTIVCRNCRASGPWCEGEEATEEYVIEQCNKRKRSWG